MVNELHKHKLERALRRASRHENGPARQASTILEVGKINKIPVREGCLVY